MPYVSKAQRGYMHVHHPKIAARWDREEHAHKAMKRRLRKRKKKRSDPDEHDYR
jgi:hypothetical protein